MGKYFKYYTQVICCAFGIDIHDPYTKVLLSVRVTSQYLGFNI